MVVTVTSQFKHVHVVPIALSTKTTSARSQTQLVGTCHRILNFPDRNQGTGTWVFRPPDLESAAMEARGEALHQ